MRILLIGGTGFIGPFLAHDLERRGHTVAVFHRGKSAPALPVNVPHLIGDRNDLGAHATDLRHFAPDVVVDLVLSSEAQAATLMQLFRGVARRVVVLSSMDVYRACAVFHGTEPGPLEPVPLTEDSALRSAAAYPPQALARLRGVFAWVDEQYDKVPVERVALGSPDLPGTVLRLPMIYGPGDPLHRLHPLLKRMDDGRRRILLADQFAVWRGPRGYVENVAAAVALAATTPRAAGRVYNVAEEPAHSELEWAKLVATAVGWRGEFVVLPRERTPRHLVIPGNLSQHWTASSRRIRTELRYREPVPLADALRRTVAWARAHPPKSFDPAQFDYASEDAAESAA